MVDNLPTGFDVISVHIRFRYISSVLDVLGNDEVEVTISVLRMFASPYNKRHIRAVIPSITVHEAGLAEVQFRAQILFDT